MAVDYCKFQISNIGEPILRRFKWKKNISKDGFIYYHYNLKSWKAKPGKKNFSLKLTLKKSTNSDYFTLTIENSLRKWYFNKNSYKRDLYKTELIDCLNKIRKLLGIRKHSFLDSKITKIEFGLNIPLKPIYRSFTEGLYFLKRMPRECIMNSLYFGKTDSSHRVILYDKLEETKSNLGNDSKILPFENKIFFLRYEIKIKYLSKCPFYKKYSSTLFDLIENFDIIVKQLSIKAQEIQYVDWVSEYNKSEINFNSQFEEMMIYRDIQRTGLHTILKEISESNSNNKSHLRKKIIEIVIRNSSGNFKSLKSNFISKLNRKIDIVLTN